MDGIEKRARELLAAEWEKCGDVGQNVATGIRAGASLPMDLPAIRAIIDALTPPEGQVVVTRNEAGQAVAVTRQDDEGRILSVIAEFATPEGYVLVPVETLEEITGYADAFVSTHEFVRMTKGRKMLHVRKAQEIIDEYQQRITNVND